MSVGSQAAVPVLHRVVVDALRFICRGAQDWWGQLQATADSVQRLLAVKPLPTEIDTRPREPSKTLARHQHPSSLVLHKLGIVFVCSGRGLSSLRRRYPSIESLFNGQASAPQSLQT